MALIDPVERISGRRSSLFALGAVIVISAAARSASAAEYVVHRWSTRDGLPNASTNQIIETRSGYLLLAGWAGTFRFDGVRFTSVAADLPNAHALAIAEDDDGSLWFGSNASGVTHWTPQGMRMYTTREGLPSDAVVALARDGGGRIWVATDRGLALIEHDQLTSVLANVSVSGLALAHDRVWFTGADHLCEAREAVVDCGRFADAVAHPRLVASAPDGSVWVSDTGNGLVDLSRNHRYRACANGPECLSGSDITALLATADGVWVGYANGAIDRVDPEATGGVQRVVEPRAAMSVRTIAQDSTGDIWFADTSIARIQKSRVRTYTSADGLTPNVSAIVQDDAGAIRVGGACGPVLAFDGTRFAPLEPRLGKCIMTLANLRDGSFWAGGEGDGLFRRAGNTTTHWGVADGLASANVRALFEARDGALWIGTDKGGVFRSVDGQLGPPLRRSDGTPLGMVVSFAEDPAGRIWVASNDYGLSVYDGGKLQAPAPAADGAELPGGNVTALLVDTRGDLWIGTAMNGLYRLREGRYEPFGAAQGMPDNLVALIVEDAEENLWIGTARGIVRLARANLTAVAAHLARIEPILLDESSGLRNAETNGGGFDPSGLRLHDGTLWFPTIDGIAVVDHDTFHVDHRAPRAIIEETRVDSMELRRDSDGALRVAPDIASIEIAYTMSGLMDAEHGHFRYRLAGLDARWTEAGTRRVAYYSRPPPGKYVFEVSAANADWAWSEQPAALRIEFLPYWWERRGVQVLAVVLGMLLTSWIALRVVSWRNRARAAPLERARAVQGERERIARDLHDELGSRLARISLLADRESVVQARSIATAARDAARAIDELVFLVDARNDTVEAFANYVAHICEEWVRGAGLAYRVRLAPALGDQPLSAFARRSLLLAIKEVLTNALKHARATELRLEFEWADGKLRIVVADNGIGMPDDGGDPTGNGLRNLRARLVALGGTARWLARAGGGTRVELLVPCREP